MHSLPLGRIGATELALPVDLQAAAIAHAQRLARALGSADYQSSLDGYWSLADRLRLWQRLLSEVGARRLRESQILEVGAGLGLFALTGCLLGYRIQALEKAADQYDHSLWMAARLFAAHGLPLPLIQAPAEQIPLADQSVDLLVSFQTFEHVADLPATLREIKRVLRPGGVLFAQCPNYMSFYEPHYGLLAPLPAGRRLTRLYLAGLGRPTAFLQHLQWIHPLRLQQQLHHAGFQISSIGAPRPARAALPCSTRVDQLPFQRRRGRYTRELAWRIAWRASKLGLRIPLFPQLEIWAVA